MTGSRHAVKAGRGSRSQGMVSLESTVLEAYREISQRNDRNT
jgi:hypothetical protein